MRVMVIVWYMILINFMMIFYVGEGGLIYGLAVCICKQAASQSVSHCNYIAKFLLHCARIHESFVSSLSLEEILLIQFDVAVVVASLFLWVSCAGFLLNAISWLGVITSECVCMYVCIWSVNGMSSMNFQSYVIFLPSNFLGDSSLWYYCLMVSIVSISFVEMWILN